MLKDLALAGLPRAPIPEGDEDRAMDVYFGLLRGEGMTRKLLRAAAKQIIVAPSKGRTRYFPTPGELLDPVRAELAERKRAITAYLRAIDMLSAPPAPQAGEKLVPDIGERLKKLGHQLSTGRVRAAGVLELPPDAPKTPSTGRKSTDAAELKAALHRRIHPTD